MDPDLRLRQMLGFVFERLDRYERGGPADLVLDNEVSEAVVGVATAWRPMDGDRSSRELAARGWHSLATLHAHRSVLIPEPERAESRALAVHYFLRAGPAGAPDAVLRERLARVAQDDWLEQIGDGHDQERLLVCLHGRIQRAIAYQAPGILREPQVDALVLAVMEATLAESPAADADPPEPDEEVWGRLGWVHEVRGYPDHGERVLDQGLSDYYFLQIADDPRLPDFVLERLADNPDALSPQTGYRMAQGLFQQYAQTANLEAMYGALHLLRRTAAMGTAAGADAGELDFLLSQAWLGRFERGGQPEHLDRAIECARAAHHTLAAGQSWDNDAAALLCHTLKVRFKLTGARADLDEAIIIGRGYAG